MDMLSRALRPKVKYSHHQAQTGYGFFYFWLMWSISKYGVSVNPKYLHCVLSADLVSEQQVYHLNILFWSVFTKESETAEGNMEYLSNLEGLCPRNPFCDWFCYCICWYSFFVCMHVFFPSSPFRKYPLWSGNILKILLLWNPDSHSYRRLLRW